MTHTRRSLLVAGAGTLAGLAGCLGRTDAGPQGDGDGGDGSDGDEGTTTNETTTTTTEPAARSFDESATVDGASVTPTGAHVQYSTLHLSTADSMAVTAPEDRQLLFVDLDVEAEGSGPRPSTFVLAAGGETHRGWTAYDGIRGYQLAPDGRRGEQYSPDEPTGWIGFELPATVGSEEIELRVDDEDEEGGSGPAWSLPDEQASKLRADPPDFEVESIEVADSVGAGETIPFSLTVANEGEGTGRFRFSINYKGPTWGADPERFSVSAGETRTRDLDLDPYGGTQSGSLDLAVVTASEEREFTVEVREGSDE